MHAVAFFRTQLHRGVFDQRSCRGRKLELGVKTAQQFEDFKVLGTQLDAFLGGQGVGDVQRPVAEVLQKTILVQFELRPSMFNCFITRY
ncbi:hypothetical protein PSYAR_20557 [Pseudomonas syringae pv. aceris str. M302273]|nr:hypothetical protein PSYAR_20557 [Pseudomonas syringae pv. aceris str. M302273]